MDKKENKKIILVTGGVGALGSFLCKKYLDEGHKVICIDNLQKTRSTINIDSFKKHKNFKFIKHDIINPISFNEKIDWIFNMACPVSCIDLQVDPIHTMKSNVHGVINMLELAKEHNAVFLQASSADIYGEKVGEVQKESEFGSVNSLSPRACYEEGKRAAETLCMDYHRQYGVNVKIARVFNTSGPSTHISDGRVLSNFIFAALSGRDLTIYGDGSATRSFLYIDDCTKALDKFIKKNKDFTGPVNIGSDDERSIKELAETVIRISNSNSKIVYDNADDAPLNRRPDISLAKKELNWKPTVQFEEIIKRMIDHYKTVNLPDKRVLVFSTTYYPVVGPAENALMELSSKMPQTEFHIITTKFEKGVPSYENVEGSHVYRIGFGYKFDKFLLPVFGPIKAFILNKKYNYHFMWSVMATYAGVAGIVIKTLKPSISFIITGTENIDNSWFKSNIVEKIRKKADREFSEKDHESRMFSKEISDLYKELLAKQEGKLVRPL